MSISVNTQKLYVRTISKLRNYYLINDLNDFDNVMSKLNTIENDRMIKLYIASIIWWDRCVQKNIDTAKFQRIDEDVMKKYGKVLSEKSKKISEIDESGKMTDKQEKKLLSWDKIIKIRETIMSTDDNFLEKMLICLYTYIPPRRLEYVYMYYIDEHHSKEFNEDLDKNYCIDDGIEIYFIINKFKMFYKMGRIKFIVPHKLKKIIRQYVKHNDIENEKKILGVNTESSLTSKLKKMFDKYTSNNGFSVQMLRHSFSSFIYDAPTRPTPGEWRSIAKLMGHNMREHMNYSKKIDFDMAEYKRIYDDDVHNMLKIKILKK